MRANLWSFGSLHLAHLRYLVQDERVVALNDVRHGSVEIVRLSRSCRAVQSDVSAIYIEFSAGLPPRFVYKE